MAGSGVILVLWSVSSVQELCRFLHPEFESHTLRKRMNGHFERV